jgi:adenylylsulfate kinase
MGKTREGGESMGVTKSRSLMKAVCWRVIATLTGAMIVFFLYGEFEAVGKFIVADIILKMIFYYAHERGWSMIKWGKVPIQAE